MPSRDTLGGKLFCCFHCYSLLYTVILGNGLRTRGFSIIQYIVIWRPFFMMHISVSWPGFSLSFQERNVDLFKNLVHEYDYTYWSCSVARLGYSGTAVISRVCSCWKVSGKQHCNKSFDPNTIGWYMLYLTSLSMFFCNALTGRTNLSPIWSWHTRAWSGRQAYYLGV